jgi:CheY-like chemotaxis protein
LAQNPDISEEVCLKAKDGKYSILVIDDEKDVLDNLRELFDEDLFKVYTASSGTEGYSRAYNLNVDAIMTDFRMPVMNGGQFVELIKSSRLLSKIPILFYTGSVEEAQKAAGESPLIAYLPKPTDIKVIESTLDKLIKKRKALVASEQDFDVDILNAVIQSALKTITMMTGVQEVRSLKAISQQELEQFHHQVVGFLQINSFQFNGALALSFSSECILQFAERLFGHKGKHLSKEVTDIAGELLNIIWGQSRLKLLAKYPDLKSGIPTVNINNQGDQSFVLADGPCVTVPLECELGTVYLLVSLALDYHKKKR